MPVVSQEPIDVKWIVQLASGTTYTGKQAAITAALTLSAANSNAPVQLAQVQEVVTAPNAPLLANVALPGAGTPLWIIQLASGTTYYPLETARVQAYSTSSSNSNAPVYIARVVERIAAP